MQEGASLGDVSALLHQPCTDVSSPYIVPRLVAYVMVIKLRLPCRAVSSRRLVPGDVVVLLPGKATCDMVLLRGSCLVEESLLSGEVWFPPFSMRIEPEMSAPSGKHDVETAAQSPSGITHPDITSYQSGHRC